MAVSSNTPIEVSAGHFRPAGELITGGPVLASGLTGQWTSEEVGFVGSLPHDGLTVLVQLSGAQLVVTPDQTFVLATKERLIVAARTLKAGDALLGADGSAVPIDNVLQGKSVGSFTTFATAVEPFEAPLNGHLVNAAGVVIGDKTVLA